MSKYALTSSHRSILVFRSKESQKDHVGECTSHENRDNGSVLVPLDGLAVFVDWWEREALANPGFDGRACRRDQVAELVRRSDHEGSEAAGTQFHEMDGNHTPGSVIKLAKPARHRRIYADPARHESTAGWEIWTYCDVVSILVMKMVETELVRTP